MIKMSSPIIGVKMDFLTNGAEMILWRKIEIDSRLTPYPRINSK